MDTLIELIIVSELGLGVQNARTPSYKHSARDGSRVKCEPSWSVINKSSNANICTPRTLVEENERMSISLVHRVG